VTNGRFQVSEFNDSFMAMNLKIGRSPVDPLQTVARRDLMAVPWPLPVIISPLNDIEKGNLNADQ
jgi:hypothetical protein